MPAIDRVDVQVCRLATEPGPLSDGTATWDATTMVIVEPRAAGVAGLGYSYVDAAAAAVVRNLLAPASSGSTRSRCRWRWPACCARSATTAAPAWSPARSARSTSRYGTSRPSCSTSRSPRCSARRAPGCRCTRAVGSRRRTSTSSPPSSRDMRPPAIAGSRSSDDLEWLRLVRDRAPPGMAIAAGEYGYDGWYFQRMLEAGAVDILQADATRALGVTGFLQANALCAARSLPLSSHCAPAIHAHAGAAASELVHLELFREHARMEAMLFDGALPVAGGAVSYASDRAGLGLVLRDQEARRHAA